MSHSTIYSVFFEWIEGRRLSAFMKNSVKNITKRSPPRSVFASLFGSFQALNFEAILHNFVPKIHPKNALFSERILGSPFERIFIPKSLQNHPKSHPKTHPKRHTKNEQRFHSTFERFPAQNGTKKAPESKAKTMPKTHAKNKVRGKTYPLKTTGSAFLCSQCAPILNRRCRNPSPDAQIVARLPES